MLVPTSLLLFLLRFGRKTHGLVLRRLTEPPPLPHWTRPDASSELSAASANVRHSTSLENSAFHSGVSPCTVNTTRRLMYVAQKLVLLAVAPLAARWHTRQRPASPRPRVNSEIQHCGRRAPVCYIKNFRHSHTLLARMPHSRLNYMICWNICLTYFAQIMQNHCDFIFFSSLLCFCIRLYYTVEKLEKTPISYNIYLTVLDNSSKKWS